MVKIVVSFLLGFLLVSWLTGFLGGEGGLVAAILTVPLDSSMTTVTVDSTQGFPNSGYAMVQNERFTYTGKTAITFTGASRGVEETVAASHPLISNGIRVKVYTEEASGINKAMGFDAGATLAQYGAIVGIPIIVWDFFTTTLPMLVMWNNLSWMDGMLAIIRTCLQVITGGLIIALALIGLNNLIQSRR